MSENFTQLDSSKPGSTRLPLLFPFIGFICAFFIALWLDKPVASFLHVSDRYLLMKNSPLAGWIKFPGDWIAVAMTLLAAYQFHKSRLGALVFSAAALLVPLSNGLIKWTVGRHRPYRFLADAIDQPIPWNCIPFRDGLPGLFKATNLSFTSGHATLSFTLATTLAILFPRYKILFFIIATLTACERFIETAHWLSDSVAGAAMGYFGVVLISRIKFFRNSLSGDCPPTGPKE